MAKVFPAKYIGKKGAEELVFHKLLSLHSDNWHFFHSVDIARHPEKVSGEIDFVAVSRTALITLEVKGGRITRTNGIWHANGREMDESPIKQAKDNYHALRRYLKKNGFSKLPGGHCCLWPDSEFKTSSIEWHSSSIIDKHGFDELLRSLESAERHFRDEAARLGRETPTLTEQSFIDICQLIHPDVVADISLDKRIQADRKTLIELSRSQSRLLDRIFDNPRLVVSGPAGCGKTLIAYEACKRLLRQNPHWRGAFACQSYYLAKDIQLQVWKDGISDRLEVLCQDTMFPFYARNALGIDLGDHPGGILETKSPGYAEDPSSLPGIDSSKLLDFLVVDEGQDIKNNLLLLKLLNACTKRGLAKCRLLWFQDPNQAIAEKLSSDNRRKLYVDITEHDVLQDCFKYNLDSINYRNPTQIAEKAEALLGIHIRHEFNGNFDRQITTMISDNPVEVLGRAIMQLERENVQEKDIVVVSVSGKSCAILAQAVKVGGKYLVYESDVFDRETGHTPPSGHVRWSRLIDVKGREFPIVILIDLPDFSDIFDKYFMYVALTRANSAVIAIGTQEQLESANLTP